MKKYACVLLLLGVVLISCGGSDTDPSVSAPNILLIIADDLGKDALSGYSEGTVKPTTPHLNALSNAGISFHNFWVYPTCSPTRASIITGKYGYRTGVKWAGDVLSSSETILHKYIQEQASIDYATATIGKWHLAGSNTLFNPETLGMDYYAGLVSGGDAYTNWDFTEDGVLTTEASYITEKFTDLSIDWIAAQDKPWFLWLAYTAPHTPFHVPPSEMHSQGNLPAYVQGVDPTPYYMAAIEALDYQIGRLLDSMSEEERANTVIIFLGDNGSPGQVIQAPYSNRKAKGSLYQGGVNTPLFISGAGVSRVGAENQLVNSTDLFATIAELVGISVETIHDSKSIKPLLSTTGVGEREFQYSEKDDGTEDAWTISNGQYKLLVDAGGNEEMYDLLADPYEQRNLLRQTLTTEQTTAKQVLETALRTIRD